MSESKSWDPRDLGCLHFSICACHPCAGAMLIFSISFQFELMIPEGNPRSRDLGCCSFFVIFMFFAKPIGPPRMHSTPLHIHFHLRAAWRQSPTVRSRPFYLTSALPKSLLPDLGLTTSHPRTQTTPLTSPRERDIYIYIYIKPTPHRAPRRDLGFATFVCLV